MEDTNQTQSKGSGGTRKRTLIALVAAVAIIAATLLIWLRANDHPTELTDSPAGQEDSPKPVRSVPANRPAHVSGTAAKRHVHAAQPGEVPILVATGYRRLQQRDFEAARDAFEEALSIDPGNSAAREGLRATQTAETVDGIAGVFGR